MYVVLGVLGGIVLGVILAYITVMRELLKGFQW